MTAAILHELNETVGQLTNAVCLLEPQRIVGNQFTTHAERAGSRRFLLTRGAGLCASEKKAPRSSIERTQRRLFARQRETALADMWSCDDQLGY